MHEINKEGVRRIFPHYFRGEVGTRVRRMASLMHWFLLPRFNSEVEKVCHSVRAGEFN